MLEAKKIQNSVKTCMFPKKVNGSKNFKESENIKGSKHVKASKSNKDSKIVKGVNQKSQKF